MSVVELTLADEARWEAFLSMREDACVFQHPAWMRVLRGACGYSPLVLGHLNADGELDGVLPLVRKNGWATGRRLVSLPHTPLAGPAAASDDVAKTLLAAALGHARASKARLEVKVRASASPREAPGLVSSPRSMSYVLELPADAGLLRFGSSRHHRRVKWAVGKAANAGVSLRDATSHDDLRRWHALYLETMRAHAVPPRPLGFFAEMWREMKPRGLMRLLLAERHGRLVAGSILLSYASTVFYAFNARGAEAFSLGANYLIQWHAIHDAARAGFRRYDLGEVEADQGGLAEFKRKWGARPEQYSRWQWPPQHERRSRGSGYERIARALRPAWQRVPLVATARVGDLVYRRL
ncbi:MAG: GNAT family N-acetyltransferase [Chloroflexota bacterium]|nr:GNAT family N-acetyltransferase [Chloroflexota bacterium]